MRRTIVGGIAALSLLVAVPTAAPAHPSVAHKTCSSRFVHGVIGGQEKCLHAGEFCAARYKRQYVRYGFRCVAGRLR